MENYSFYLFTKLFDVVIGVDYEYDYMYEDLKYLYTLYNESIYNVDSKGEYECMWQFFYDNLMYIKNKEYLLDI